MYNHDSQELPEPLMEVPDPEVPWESVVVFPCSTVSLLLLGEFQHSEDIRQTFESDIPQCTGCSTEFPPLAYLWTPDYDLCRTCFFSRADGRRGWNRWIHHPSDGSPFTCNCCGEQSSAECFCPNLDQCNACNKSGRGIEQGLSLPNSCSPARSFWPEYREGNEQSYFPMRQVSCAVCHTHHITLLEPYLKHQGLHIVADESGRFVCEWCRMCVCRQCGAVEAGSDAVADSWVQSAGFDCSKCGPLGGPWPDREHASHRIPAVLQAAVREAGSEHREHCPGCQEQLLQMAKKTDYGPDAGQPAQSYQSKQEGRLLQAFSLPRQPPVNPWPVPAAMLEARSLPTPAASRAFHLGSMADQAADQSFGCMPYPELVRPETHPSVRPPPTSLQPPVPQPYQPPPAQQRPQPPLMQQQPLPPLLRQQPQAPPQQRPQAPLPRQPPQPPLVQQQPVPPPQQQSQPPIPPQQPQPPQERRPTQPGAQWETTAASPVPQAAQPAPKPTEQNPKRKKKWMTANTFNHIRTGLQIASSVASLANMGYNDYNNGDF